MGRRASGSARASGWTRSPRAAALVVGLVALSVLAACDPVPDPNNPPVFTSAHGVTVLDQRKVDGLERTYEVDITSDLIDPGAVNGPHRVRITLPVEYYTLSAKLRYPVLYLLHGGGGGRASDWTAAGAAEAITEPHRLITVMPDGGKVGWYTDWVDSSQGAQAWEQFHLEQLIPWVDANLRTAAWRESRAVAGLSMGGFGAIHYAQQRPDLFAFAGSFSGALNIQNAAVQLVISQQSVQNGFPADGAFGPPTGGTWAANNPVLRAADLRDVEVALYAGSGIHDLDLLERVPGATTHEMHLALQAEGIAHHYWMYGRNPQPTTPYRCDGGHNFGCWSFALNDMMPKLMARLVGP